MDLQSANFWSNALAGASASCGPAIRIMEVCGSHTHAIARNSLRELLPPSVKLLSGPGCPICVSGALFIEKIRTLLQKNTIVTLFGDLLRIPGTRGTLPAAKNLQAVYSPEDALDIALKTPDKEVIFAAVGFAPTLAAASALMQGALESGIKNFSLLADFKELTPVLNILCSKRTLSGLLLPGHVASITGKNSFKNLPVPAVISGFEPENILHSIQILLKATGRNEQNFLCNNYPEAVRDEGNLLALNLIDNFFEPADSVWRGLGNIPSSGWKLKKEFDSFDAETRFDLTRVTAEENSTCCCGKVLTAEIEPAECPLFGKACTPQNPAGACMSSAEGTCAAAYQSGGVL